MSFGSFKSNSKHEVQLFILRIYYAIKYKQFSYYSLYENYTPEKTYIFIFKNKNNF